MYRNFLILGVALGSLFLLVGCSKASTQTPTVVVTANEWSFTPSITSVKAGDVTFELANRGKEEHELVVLKTDLASDALKMRAADPEKVDEDASAENLGEIEGVPAGIARSVTFLSLARGHYLLICNVAKHYTKGMVTAFEVK